MKLKVKILALVLVMIAAFTGCEGTTSTMIGSVETKTNNSYNLKYKKFSGKKEINFSVKEDNHEITVNVGTDSGKLNIVLVSKDDTSASNPFIKVDDVQTTTMKGELDSGSYTLIMTAEEHAGGISIAY